MSKFIEKDKNGDEVVRWEKDKNLSKEQKHNQWREAEKEVKKGKVICITDLI